MESVVVDMWYGDSLAECEKADCFFSDCDCIYRGNFYKKGRIVGDYTARTRQDIERLWERTHNARREK